MTYRALLPLALSLGCSASADRGATPSGLPDDSGPPVTIDGGNGIGADALPEGDAEPFDPNACKNVDVLFVVDNSGSMADNQKSLAARSPRRS